MGKGRWRDEEEDDDDEEEEGTAERSWIRDTGGGREGNEEDMVVGHYVQGGYTDVRKKGQRGP